MVIAGESHVDAMVVIHNTCDCIEAEAIHLVLCQVPGQVGQKEAQDFILRVVEDHRVPFRVMASLTSVAVAVICPIEAIDTVVDIIAGV